MENTVKTNYNVNFYEDLIIGKSVTVPVSKLCRVINALDKSQSEIVYLIMIMYYVNNSCDHPVSKTSPVLYGGKESDGKPGIIFSIEDLPKQLLDLIGKYVTYLQGSP
uniref:BET bromodomain protein n=1 Tax=Pithovirus LCPAC404 TaxID=2506597 RepID=A0A481ZES2_9VIRU|nr:MAG: BET bromodomain protein [Pithovirus LCPAC404]